MSDKTAVATQNALPAGWSDVERSIYERVRHFVADAADVELDEVTPLVDIFEELKVDSLGIVLILVNLEDEYDIPQPEDDREATKNLRTPVDIVEFAMSAAGLR